ncbi:hypothetical protein THRCLA_23352 [Thraustotheca clavata]|uniref:HIT domain-containing protein n=1 Tax=Thraustotheca clavata TaxID=74557 RepID=A0A1V9Y725_9STRA|nr:hypothetical protein THRCLA_23352 [Thraustotheca clavata]
MRRASESSPPMLMEPLPMPGRVIVVNANELGGDYVKKGVAYSNRDKDVMCCKFCHIVAACTNEVIYDEEHISVFRPLHPASKSHILVVPKHHLRNINYLTPTHLSLLMRMKEVAEYVLSELGYCNKYDAKLHLAFHSPPFNSIDHVHMHAMVKTRRTALGSVKYKTGTWWCRSYTYVVNRLLVKQREKSSSTIVARPRALSFHGRETSLCETSHRKFGTYPPLDHQTMESLEII